MSRQQEEQRQKRSEAEKKAERHSGKKAQRKKEQHRERGESRGVRLTRRGPRCVECGRKRDVSKAGCADEAPRRNPSQLAMANALDFCLFKYVGDHFGRFNY